MEWIRAGKQDCFGVDRIWLMFDKAECDEPVCVHEKVEGYEALVEEMQRRCAGKALDEEWWKKVAFPAFRVNHTVVWRRSDVGLAEEQRVTTSEQGATSNDRGNNSAHRVTEGQAMYSQMRSVALEFRLGNDTPALIPHRDIHGLLVDWVLRSGAVATVVCMNDGAASMYLSNGGGIIGAGEHQSVRQVACTVLTEAVHVRTHFAPSITDEAPPSQSGCMRMTLITDAGLLTAESSDDLLRNSIGPIAKLGNLVQRLIAEIRTVSSPKIG